MSNKPPYRPEIDGLRAIAVVSVIFYHAKLPSTGFLSLEGGYIGVDIFFVISGYLIFRIINSAYKTEEGFSLLQFYSARARRLLPVLLVTIWCTMVVGVAELLPSDAVTLAKSAGAALLFFSNFFFYGVTTEYGAESSLLIPLLHTWSLGVEEQFYLCFPFLAMVLLRAGGGWKACTVLLLLSVLSFLWLSISMDSNPSLSFFSPIGRFWEFIVGAALVRRDEGIRTEFNPIANNLCTALGVSLIIYSVFGFSAQTAHPSVMTIIPVTGVALIIAFGSSRDLVGKMLSSPPMVGLGLISYSLYLIHYPLFAFARVQSGGGSEAVGPELLPIVLFGAIGLYYLVERPMRRKLPQRRAFLIIGVVAGTLFPVIAYTAFSRDFEQQWIKYAAADKALPYLLIRDTQKKTPTQNSECMFNVIDTTSVQLNERLSYCREKNGAFIYVLGDSHATNIFNIYSYSARYKNVVGVTQGGCRPHGCPKPIKNQYKFFREELIDTTNHEDIIIFHQSGSYLISDASGKNDSQAAFDDGVFAVDYENILEVDTFLKKLAGEVKAKVVWLGPFVEYRHRPKDIYHQADQGRSVRNLMTINKNSRIIFEKLDAVLDSYERPGIEFIPFNKFFMVEDNALVRRGILGNCFQFRDADHFSECGEKNIAATANFSIIQG